MFYPLILTWIPQDRFFPRLVYTWIPGVYIVSLTTVVVFVWPEFTYIWSFLLTPPPSPFSSLVAVAQYLSWVPLNHLELHRPRMNSLAPSLLLPTHCSSKDHPFCRFVSSHGQPFSYLSKSVLPRFALWPVFGPYWWGCVTWDNLLTASGLVPKGLIFLRGSLPRYFSIF